MVYGGLEVQYSGYSAETSDSLQVSVDVKNLKHLSYLLSDAGIEEARIEHEFTRDEIRPSIHFRCINEKDEKHWFVIQGFSEKPQPRITIESSHEIVESEFTEKAERVLRSFHDEFIKSAKRIGIDLSKEER